MLLQRARGAENRVKHRSSNGPRIKILFVLDRGILLSRTFLLPIYNTRKILCRFTGTVSFRRRRETPYNHKEVIIMKFSPSIEEVKAIAATGEYMVLPVSCEILSDICTPIETMKILKNVSTHCYMLESVAEKEKWGRYTFLGFDPKLEITCVDGELKAGDTLLRTEHPSEFLRRILAEYKSPRFDYLPSFTGGLVGYFSYDYLGYSEPAVRTKVQDTENFKDVDLMLFDKVIAFDNFRQKSF